MIKKSMKTILNVMDTLFMIPLIYCLPLLLPTAWSCPKVTLSYQGEGKLEFVKHYEEAIEKIDSYLDEQYHNKQDPCVEIIMGEKAFRVEKFLGHGDISEVYLLKDPVKGKKAVIKIPAKERGDSYDESAQVIQAQLITAYKAISEYRDMLKHKNILTKDQLPIVEIFVDESPYPQAYVLAEYVPVQEDWSTFFKNIEQGIQENPFSPDKKYCQDLLKVMQFRDFMLDLSGYIYIDDLNSNNIKYSKGSDSFGNGAWTILDFAFRFDEAIKGYNLYKRDIYTSERVGDLGRTKLTYIRTDIEESSFDFLYRNLSQIVPFSHIPGAPTTLLPAFPKVGFPSRLKQLLTQEVMRQRLEQIMNGESFRCLEQSEYQRETVSKFKSKAEELNRDPSPIPRQLPSSEEECHAVLQSIL